MTISGGCSCGAVRYSTAEKPVLQGNCHCRECQRMTGSGFSATMFFPEGSLSASRTARRDFMDPALPKFAEAPPRPAPR